MLRLHRAGFGYSIVTWAEFAGRVEKTRPDAVTVDVFETCVVRDLAGDRAIEEVAARWVADSEVADADRTTCHAEAIASLDLDLCQPVPGAVEALDRVRAVVGHVVFISDTDQSSKLLIEMLGRHDLFRTGDRLVASCEEGVTKSKGGLYDLIWSTRPDTVWHLGNNTWADCVMAAAHGYEPFHIPSGNLSRYETALCKNPSGMGPLLAGAARSTRLQLEYEFEGEKLDERTYLLNLLGAQVAGPVMAAFALWIADQVGEHGIDHLGFLARDGELPQLITNRVPDLSLQTAHRSYIHLNRLAVTLVTAAAIGVDAWVEEGTRDESAFLRTKMHAIPYDGLLQRLGFEPDDVAKTMGTSFALAAHDPQEPLRESQTQDWLTLLTSQATQELVLVRATERRTALVDYLDQLGLLSATQPAFVDVGWRGRMARLVNTALLEYFTNEPIHLHFGGDEVSPDVDERVQIHRFAFPGVTKIAPFENPPAPVETITASGKARVTDYRRTKSGAVEPLFEPNPADVGQVDRAELWRGALTMADRLPSASRILAWAPHPDPLDEEARELLRLWWYHPSREDASPVSAFVFETDEAGIHASTVAVPYALSEIFGRNRLPRKWRQGSEAISPLPSKIGLRVALLGRRLLGK